MTKYLCDIDRLTDEDFSGCEAVLRSFMHVEQDLHADIPDIMELVEICLVFTATDCPKASSAE